MRCTLLANSQTGCSNAHHRAHSSPAKEPSMPVSDQLVADLIARLDALERENAILKEHTATLLARVEGSPVPSETNMIGGESPLERTSRRWLLRRGMQVAAATAVAGVLLERDAD